MITCFKAADPLMVYFLLFQIAFLKNFIPLLPLDISIALIGYLLLSTKLSIFMAVIWPSIGSTMGFMVIYMISRRLGLKLYDRNNSSLSPKWIERIHRIFPPAELELVRKRFAKHGYFAVLINRFLLGSRSFISPVAGIMDLNACLVFLSAGLSATAWNVLLIFGGFYLGNEWQKIGGLVAQYTIPVTVLFFIAFFFAALKHAKERKAWTRQENQNI
ncbi:MAG: DedA family protein [Chlorobiaceae bacterium]|nr:DedA family protein [Chlorobiaceae bacterium]